MKITRTVEIRAPPEAVWEIVGSRFADIGVWATRITSSHAVGPSSEAPLTGRACAVALPGVDAVEETLVSYDEAAMTLAYRGTGLPDFVSDARNQWTVQRVGDASRVVVEGQLRLTGWARVLALPMRVALTREGQRTLADLRHFAEHGEPRLQKRTPRWSRPRLEVVETRLCEAPPDVAWMLVRDLESYGSVAGRSAPRATRGRSSRCGSRWRSRGPRGR